MAGSNRLVRTLVGHAEMRSLAFSSEWRLIQGDDELAVVRRFARQHMSSVRLTDGTVWTIAPQGWGTVLAAEGGVPFARIVRRSWLGRRWEISTIGFATDLLSRPAPRRWRMAIGGESIAELAGSALSYNRLSIDALIGVPVAALVLAWQVLARPWEAAAYPVVLVPERGEQAPPEAAHPEPA